MEPSSIAGIVGAVLLGLLGWLGKSAAAKRKARDELAALATASEIEIRKAEQARPWAIMDLWVAESRRRNEELVEECESLTRRNEELWLRLNEQRITSTDWEIKARKLAAKLEGLGGNPDESTERTSIEEGLRLEMIEMRNSHHLELERLRQDMRTLEQTIVRERQNRP